MDTCDRYALHERYKNTVKKMMTDFGCELFITISELNGCESSEEVIEFISRIADKWVEYNIRPEKFEG